MSSPFSDFVKHYKEEIPKQVYDNKGNLIKTNLTVSDIMYLNSLIKEENNHVIRRADTTVQRPLSTRI